MGWARTPADERAASEASELAAERAHARARMTPYEQQVVELLAEIRDALRALAAPKPVGPQTSPTKERCAPPARDAHPIPEGTFQ